MSFLSNLNFASTVISFGCVSFAASNFGVKFGRAVTFNNPSGYTLVSDSNHSEKLYKEIAKEAANDSNAPEWAKKDYSLRRWCNRNQSKARKWQDTSKYCLIKNNVKHQLLNKGLELKEEKETASQTAGSNGATTPTTKENEGCTKELFESYADSTGTSVGYLFAIAKCSSDPSKPAAVAGVPGA